MYWPLQENFLDQKSIDSLCNFIKKNKRLTQFKKVKEFENKFAKWNGSKYSVFVNSGSSANLLIIQCTKELYKWKNCTLIFNSKLQMIKAVDLFSH